MKVAPSLRTTALSSAPGQPTTCCNYPTNFRNLMDKPGPGAAGQRDKYSSKIFLIKEPRHLHDEKRACMCPSSAQSKRGQASQTPQGMGMVCQRGYGDIASSATADSRAIRFLDVIKRPEPGLTCPRWTVIKNLTINKCFNLEGLTLGFETNPFCLLLQVFPPAHLLEIQTENLLQS